VLPIVKSNPPTRNRLEDHNADERVNTNFVQ